MGRGSDSEKRRQWAERLERYARSGKTVAQFCADECVSQASFYLWKRRLTTSSAVGNPRSKQDEQIKTAAFRPVLVASPVASGVNVRMPDGIVIELGSEWSTIEKVVCHLLDRKTSAKGD